MSRRLAPIWMIIIPSAILGAICQAQAWHFNSEGAALESKDCQSFLRKAQLERAWWGAHDLLHNCTRDLTQITGASMEETLIMTNFRDCDGYRETQKTYGQDWDYLE